MNDTQPKNILISVMERAKNGKHRLFNIEQAVLGAIMIEANRE